MNTKPGLILLPTLISALLPFQGPAATQERHEPTDRTHRIVELTNRARQQVGCPKVHPNPRLTRTARLHSADMADNGYLGHVGSRGHRAATRARAGGYPSRYVGENVAAGNITAEKTFEQWINSPAHRRNILNCAFTDIGVGHSTNPDSEWKHYWTQMFGRSIP
ncbi:CAP domain-containing protein [Actinopolyspora mortivallis]|uniref:CAP domain-containing protein n=1 Tax=Actinopolyspora mortivallis TaxID=33906 RepID=UPI00035C7453|nr:CAP domain-containing protein [Actinopolyspora mortivallis]